MNPFLALCLVLAAAQCAYSSEVKGFPTIPKSSVPSQFPTRLPTNQPSFTATISPTENPTTSPTNFPTLSPTRSPTAYFTNRPTISPSILPTRQPSTRPSHTPTVKPTVIPPTNPPIPAPTSPPSTFITTTSIPSARPTTRVPTFSPTTQTPTVSYRPTQQPSSQPTSQPSNHPTSQPTILGTLVVIKISQSIQNVTLESFTSVNTSQRFFLEIVSVITGGIALNAFSVQNVTSLSTKASSSSINLRTADSFSKIVFPLKPLWSTSSTGPIFGVLINYDIDIIAEDYGYSSGKAAVDGIVSKLQISSLSDDFVNRLKLTGSRVFEYASSTHFTVISNSTVFVHSAPPTRQPTSVVFYTSFPLYGQVLFPAAIAIVGAIICYFMYKSKCMSDLSVFYPSRAHKYEKKDDPDGADITSEYGGLNSPGKLTIELNPYVNATRRSLGSPKIKPDKALDAQSVNLGSDAKAEKLSALFNTSNPNPLAAAGKKRNPSISSKSPSSKNPSNITNKAFFTFNV